ncbi:hypothetical protein G7059_03600 [Erysipelothrix sp. HDW6A]|uniref:hypothetical protein n=1 Tax=Erysipelothrix sp. HDW6A TaxID=2714928 RepID=UPI001409017D|nr:hypothetical protein [Erysipelothrix sp. HDW6A]QIK56996.1 hypothetical protein G7059_03600 [Erysipelothrix sp. HDW6A]
MTYSNKKFESNDWYHFGFDVWYSFQNVRDLKQEISKMHASNKRFLSKSKNDGMVIDELVDAYLSTAEVSNKNCKKYKKNKTNKKHQKRFGAYFLIHIGKNYSMSFQVKILNEFIKQVCYGEENLPYFAVSSKNKDSIYIHLWICDREFVKNEPRVYANDYWQKDGKRCTANTPGGVLLHKEGDIQYDKDGKPKMMNGWRQNKTRIFAESLKTSSRRWRDAFVAAFYCILRQNEPGLKFKLKKFAYDADYELLKNDIEELNKLIASRPDREYVRVNRDGPDWKNIKYREIASLQYFIKYVIHELISDDIDNWRTYEPDAWNGLRYIDYENPPTAYGKALRDLFKNFNHIFNTWEFIDDKGVTRKIMFDEPAETLINLKDLRERFKSQVNKLLTIYRPELAY